MTDTEEPGSPPDVDRSIVARLTGRWAILFVVAAGCLAPLVVYNHDAYLRYRVHLYMGPGSRITGILSVLRIQAGDQPLTLIALLAPVGALVYVIIARTIRGARTARATPVTKKRIGGWLAVFMISTAVGAIGNVRFLYDTRHTVFVDVSALPHLGDTRSPQLVLLFIARYLLVMGVVWAAIYGFWLIVRRRPRAPGYWTITCAALAPVMVLDRAMAAWQRTFAARIQVADYPQVPLGISATSAALACLLWCAYWLRSRRVLETFGRRGLDLFAKPTPPVGPPPQTVLEESTGLTSQT